MPYLKNPQRSVSRFASKRNLRRWALQLPFVPLVRLLVWLGFENIDFAYIHGPDGRLRLGDRVSTMDTLFNVVSGKITVGDDTIFGHGCQVLTGEHRFEHGRRVSLQGQTIDAEVPQSGNDIVIGSGCFLGSGVIVTKGVTIGDNALVGAGSVVTKDLPSGCFAAGVPARVLEQHHA